MTRHFINSSKVNFRQILFSGVASLSVALGSCGGGNEQHGAPPPPADTAKPQPAVSVPTFNDDSAYAYVGAQVAFGPRTPGSEAQKKCAGWMERMLKAGCDTVYRQSVQVKGGDGKMLPCINLVGSINPGAKKRILFLTHWDSRPWADQDTKDQDKPILAADDGGSGVGVLLEMARVLRGNKLPANLGIDILFTDVEDYGRTEWGENSYCLGTQYWARKPHIPGYRADFGILLDMVGAHGAQFPIEQFSSQYANEVVTKVWQAASNAGYGSYFPYIVGPPITDDHVPVNMIANIKTIDIIHMTQAEDGPFPPHWHTHADNMNVIDRTTLKAVGQTLLQVIYETAASTPAANM